MIDALKKQHNALTTDNNVICSTNKMERQKKPLVKSLETYTIYCNKIKQMKANLQETDHQIKKLEKQVFSLRSKQITDQQCKITIQSGQKNIETLKNTLDNAVKRFCLTLTDNRRVREHIDHLLKERERFNCSYKKKLRLLDNGRKEIFDLIEKATNTYDQREEWCNKLVALHTRTQHDTLLHNREMRELQRRLDYDSCLHEFLQIKGQKRVMRDLEIKERKRKEFEKEKAEKELKLYEVTLNMIKELTGEKNVQRLASIYVKQEEENFALFNYVNELGSELEELDVSIQRLNDEIEEQKRQNEIREEQQEKGVTCLKEQLKTIKIETNETKVSLENETSKLENFLKEIEDLFVFLDCKKTPALELVGRTIQITSHNVFVYLEMIEKKIESILHDTIKYMP